MEDVKPARPKLKINLSGKVEKSAQITNSQPVQTPLTMTPSQTPATPSATKHKIKLTMTKSVPATPADGTAPVLAAPAPTPAIAPAITAEPKSITKTKAGRTSKPTAKKRAKDHGGDEEAGGTTYARPLKKVRLMNGFSVSGDSNRRVSQKLSLKVKTGAGEKPPREPGTGYDSEMEGAEDDPIIEEQFIFRMADDENLDYLRRQLDERKIGAGADFKVRFLDDRRACVTVAGQLYAAVLVDLPTITEGMKTWDRKALVKSADICQMLFVFDKVKNELEAKTAGLPKSVMDGHRWPHGLTPPMHDCVHRRFRKRLSHKDILNKEAEVSRLLAADAASDGTRWEWVDERRATTAHASEDEDHDGYQDAEGEEDEEGYFPADSYQQDDEDAEIDEADLEAELAAAMLEDDMEIDTEETPAQVGATPLTTNTATPAANADTQDNVDELFDDDDDDDDDDEDLDPDEKEHREQVRGVKEEVREINAQIKRQMGALAGTSNKFLQQRVHQKIKSLRSERRIKLAGVGLPDMHDEFEDPDDEE